MSNIYFAEYRFIAGKHTVLLNKPVDFILNHKNIFFIKTFVRKWQVNNQPSAKIRLVNWRCTDSGNKSHGSFRRDLIIEIKGDSLK